MKKIAIGIMVCGLVLSPVIAIAANQTGHGTNGNNGQGNGGGGAGNQGNSSGVGNSGHGGGGNGGGNGGGTGGGDTGGGNGGGGNSGGAGGGNVGTGVTGAPAGGGGSAASTSGSVAGSSVGQGGSFQGHVFQHGNGLDRVKVLTDLQACAAGGQKASGLIGYDTKADGSFTYWSADLGSHYDFGQCLKDKGYALRGATRNNLTNFGTR